MCKFASFLWRADPFEVRVHDLTSHAITQEALGLRDGPEPNG